MNADQRSKARAACRKVKRIAQESPDIGSLSALASRLNLTQQAVSKWDVVPWTQARVVSEITGVPLADLRPDLYA